MNNNFYRPLQNENTNLMGKICDVYYCNSSLLEEVSHVNRQMSKLERTMWRAER